jgi:ubiquinone/menaquinone biosynthesis C-methylase UbiE
MARGDVNSWRHGRMRDMVLPLLESFPGASWLTVGDGRYGMDAHFLEQHGAEVVASDISEKLLIQAQSAGLIQRFSKQNAENLSFEDGSFDLVFCKESYHHFPRPLLALHEMLRVARMGVALIEPQDFQIPRGGGATLFRLLKDGVKRLLGRPAEGHDFEEIGNFIYKISFREVEKVALGCGYPMVAFKGINDFYCRGLEKVPLDKNAKEFRLVRRKIAWFDFLCRLGINQHGLLCAVLFKHRPSDDCVTRMKAADFRVVELPANPWLKA